MKRYAPWRTRSTGAVLALALSKAHGWSTALISTRAVAYRYYSSAGSWGSDKALRRDQPRGLGRGWRRTSVRMQVWSNPQAVQDYKDLLGGQAPEEKVDGPSVIVGKGRLGTALASMGMGEDMMLGRGEGIPEDIPGSSVGEGDDGGMVREFPIYVCVPENEVASVIDSCPPEKREDLVFLQSGCLEPLLKSRGLCRNDQTQATLFFSVDKVGARPKEYLTNIGTDSRGEAKLAGETMACGKWKGALAMRLERSAYNLRCAKVRYGE
ncbi:unnamed protein product [Ascophyllum nodosum]